MPALKLDVSIEQYATFQRSFSLEQLSGGSFNIPPNSTVQAQLRTIKGALVATFTTAISYEENAVLIELSAAQTAALTVGRNFTHCYDVILTTPAGIVYRIAEGSAQIIAGQTHL